MLRRVDNCNLIFRKGTFGSRGTLRLQVGSRTHHLGRAPRAEFDRIREEQRDYPVSVAEIDGRVYWIYRDRYFWDNDDLAAEEVHALLSVRDQRERARINRAREQVAIADMPRSGGRKAIADDVKQLVWTRDGGACQNCGSTIELQFDHVIPLSMGGANTPENLQILCGPCNRRKADGLTIS